MGFVGFGTYRMSSRSTEHRKALQYGLENGCKLIDTSSNYTNGESEKLIGEVLGESQNYNPTIVTKAGYIQGSNLENIEKLNSNGRAVEDLVKIDSHLMHSIHPEFLDNQIDQSLARLQKKSLDVFLLHNPEYYFNEKNATQDEYYSRIEKSFLFLEEQVEKGRIKSYGISSNNFVLPLNDKNVTSLESVIHVAKKISSKNHFTHIQFPFNLIEIGALEKFGDYGDNNLIETAQKYNLTTMSNRPLNAFINNQLVRLATYENLTMHLNHEEALEHFNVCLKLMESKFNQSKDLSESDENFYDITLIKQFVEIWNKLKSPDSVEQVYIGHLFPFIANLWGNGGLNPTESKPFYKLMDYSNLYARQIMSQTALDFRKQAQSVSLLPEISDRPFSVEVIETYLDYGIDIVLLGMKKSDYIDQVKHLF